MIKEEDIFPIAQGLPTHWSLVIRDYDNSEESCNKLKQQILENQRIVERLESRINELQKFLDDIESAKEVIDNISGLAGMLEKQQLKELQSILKGGN